MGNMFGSYRSDATLQMHVCLGMLTCVCEYMLPSEMGKCTREGGREGGREAGKILLFIKNSESCNLTSNVDFLQSMFAYIFGFITLCQ